MGVSTDGIICYGILLGDEYEYQMPWGPNEDEEDPWEGSEDDWWFVGEHGYKPPFEMFDERGEWIGGKEWPKEKVNEYYDHKRNFEAANPMPFEMVNSCSGDYPTWLICVPGTVISANRGNPKAFNPSHLLVPDDALTKFRSFMEKYFDAVTYDPQWYLGSYWG